MDRPANVVLSPGPQHRDDLSAETPLVPNFGAVDLPDRPAARTWPVCRRVETLNLLRALWCMAPHGARAVLKRPAF